MIDKQFIVDDVFVCGVYFQENFNRLTIGGNNCFTLSMMIIIEEYFKVRKYDEIKTSINKVKFVMNCSKRKYLYTLKRMKNDGLILKKTNNLNRIWW
jgi:hypothetical protein